MWPFPDRGIAEREFSRIVVRVPHPLGDQIMATPAIEGLRARYPGAHITLHGTKVAEGIYAGLPFFDDFLVSAKKESPFETARRLRQREYEAAIFLSNSFRAALPAFLARIPHRIGYRRSLRGWMLTAHKKRPRPGGKRGAYSTKQSYADLVGMLGAEATGRVRLALSDDQSSVAQSWFDALELDDSKILPLVVGAAYGPSKRWPPEHFAAVADHFVEKYGATPVLLLAPGEEQIGEAVEAAAKHRLVNTSSDPLGIRRLKAVISRARVLVTNDTGPRHIAAAFRVPVVCMLGSMGSTYTDDDLDDQVILSNPVPCWPCEKKVCNVEGFPCMTGLAPGRVIEAVEGFWE